MIYLPSNPKGKKIIMEGSIRNNHKFNPNFSPCPKCFKIKSQGSGPILRGERPQLFLTPSIKNVDYWMDCKKKNSEMNLIRLISRVD